MATGERTTTVPGRIAGLDKDPRTGFYIPWNVARDAQTNAPMFAVTNDLKHAAALQEGLCPICGGKLGKWKWFLGGPRSAFEEHGWYKDLPCHHECARYALETCPYLALARYLARANAFAGVTGEVGAPVVLDENTIPERPALFVAVASDGVEIMPRGATTLVFPYVRPARPCLDWEYWRHGQRLDPARGEALVREAMGPQWAPPPRRKEF